MRSVSKVQMKYSWVSNTIEFFENNIKKSFRSSFRNNRARIMKNSKPGKSDCYQDANVSEDSSSSEHCYTVERATRIFENKDLAKNMDFNNNNYKRSKMVSSYDIFSGSVDDYDIPPIEADIEEDGVYPIADNLACSTINDQTAKHKKLVMKSNSYANRKNNFKKLNAKSLTNNTKVDKENEGVIIRMRNQESYYDGKDKYQSQLPEPPLYQVYENTRLRRSLYTQKALDKSVDLSEADINPNKIQNSIIYPDSPLPLVDKSLKLNDKSTTEEDNESIELEPNIDNDSYPDNKVFQLFSENSQRLRWAETEEGKKLIKMQKLGEDTIKWQEAQFEVITSEASYYRSLEILVNKIYKSPSMNCYKDKTQTMTSESLSYDFEEPASPQFKPIINAMDKHHLFSNILEIHIVSGELLKALESRWRENPLISDLSDIIVDFCQEKLKPYVTYLRNQRYQTDTYNRLLNSTEFNNFIKVFENDPDCGMMNLCSFLMLPMQRVLRLKLLMTVVKNYTPTNLSTSGSDTAIEALEKLIKECSDEKMVMEQKEEILKIFNKLIIKDNMKFSIGSKPLLKNGEMKIVPTNSIASKSIGSRFINRNNNKAQLYLFEDQLIIARRRKLPLCVSSSDDREIVVDTCPRFDVKFDMPPNSPKIINRSPTNFKLVLVRGMKGTAEYGCTVETQDELNDWKNVLSMENNSRDEFDFNEVFVIKDYTPTSKKELELKKGQILNIIKRIDQNRAIAHSSGKQGEISLKHVQFLSTPQPSHDLLNDLRLATCQIKSD